MTELYSGYNQFLRKTMGIKPLGEALAMTPPPAPPKPEPGMALGKAIEEVQPDDLPKLQEIDKSNTATYQKALTSMTPDMPDYEKVNKLLNFSANRVNIINDIIAGKRQPTELPGLPESVFNEHLALTDKVKKSIIPQVEAPTIPMAGSPVGVKTGIEPIKMTQPIESELKYAPEATEKPIPFEPETATAWRDYLKNVTSPENVLKGVGQVAAIPFRPFEAAYQTQLAKMQFQPDEVVKIRQAQALAPELFGDDQLENDAFGQVMEKAGLTKGEQWAWRVPVFLSEAILAPGGAAIGKAGINKASSIAQAFKISEKEAAVWLKLGKVPDEVANKFGEFVKATKPLQEAIAKPMVGEGANLESGMARIRKGVPEGKPPASMVGGERAKPQPKTLRAMKQIQEYNQPTPKQYIPGYEKYQIIGNKKELKKKWLEYVKGGNQEEAYKLQQEFINKGKQGKKPIHLLSETPPYYPSVMTDTLTPEMFAGAKDRSVFGMIRETLERNIEDVFGKNADTVKNVTSTPIAANETKRAKWLTSKRLSARKKMDELGIKIGSKEGELIMDYGEGIIESYDIVKGKKGQVIHASNWFRKEYDEILSLWNKKRVEMGYDPIPKRKDYFRHIQEIDSVSDRIGVILNENNIPTEIAGLTDIFKPGKPFTGAELQRKGGKYLKDPIKSFDNYIDSVSRQIYHLDSVQRVRALENHIRLLGKENAVNLPNFVANISEYGNLLSGKKAKFDRAFESVFGRGIYGMANWLRKRTSANMIAGNLSSAIMNNIVLLTQAPATMNKLSWVKGMAHGTIGPFMKDIAQIGGQESAFLARRYGPRKIQYNIMDKGVNIANWFFEATDKFSARSIVAGMYDEFLKKGLSPANAMKETDKWASRMIADRSLGQLPNISSIKTLAPITQFQTEINNVYSFLKKDIPRQYQGSVYKTMNALAQFSIYSWVFNNVAEDITGRRPVLDPIYAVATALGETELGQKPTGEKKEWYNRLYLATRDIANNMPFVGGIAGGRFPITAGIPDVGGIRTGEKSAVSELSRPLFYTVFPFGGSQVKKTVEGSTQYIKGKGETKSGKKKYDVEPSSANLARSVLFGKYAVPEAREYYTKERFKYPVKYTEKEFNKVKEEMGFTDTYADYLKELAGHKETLEKKAAENETIESQAKEILPEFEALTEEQRADWYDKTVKSDKKLAHKVTREYLKKKYKHTPEESLLLSFGVENGERAKSTYEKVMKLPENQRADFIDDYINRKIISKQVLKQLGRLVKTKGQSYE